jgi:N-sulfoglucosamine sulfohydrolase
MELRFKNYFRLHLNFISLIRKNRMYLPFLLFLILIQTIVWGKEQGKANIVLIVSDDHGIDALGCYGNPVIKTPVLDGLAKKGTRFTNAFCTSASCSPSRSVILSGMHNHTNGMYGLEHSFHHFSSFDHVKSLPVLLAEKNYRTARVGKFHIAPEEVYKFEKVFSSGTANQPDSVSLGRSPIEMAELCQCFINEESEKPFFLYYATDDPHRSNIYLPNGDVSFDTYPEPNDFGNQRKGVPCVNEIIYNPEEVIVPSFLPDTKECRAELAQYYQSVSRLDQGIGKLIKILKSADKYENTLIIYISDNGVAFPGAKTTLYEPGIRLPCIVKAPGQKTSFIQNGLISWTDITPTILDYARAGNVDENFHGRSFREIVESENTIGWDEVFASHSLHEVTMYYPMRMVREKKYKLIYNIAHQLSFPFALDLRQSPTWISTENSAYYGQKKKEQFIERPQFELYDLENDPEELINLASNSAHAEILEQMKEKIKSYQKKTGDPWFYKWEFE